MALPGTLATRGVPLQRLLGGERVVVVGVGGEGAGFEAHEARLTGREVRTRSLITPVRALPSHTRLGGI